LQGRRSALVSALLSAREFGHRDLTGTEVSFFNGVTPLPRLGDRRFRQSVGRGVSISRMLKKRRVFAGAALPVVAVALATGLWLGLAPASAQTLRHTAPRAHLAPPQAPLGGGSLCANVSGFGSAICGDLSSANVGHFSGSPTRYAQLAGTSAV